MKKSIVLIIMMICVYAMFRFPYSMINPGELLEGHKKIKEDCGSCHTFFKGTTSEKCVACHQLSKIGLDTMSRNKKNSSFHQHLTGQKCTSCHTDHIGATPQTTVTNFSHELLVNTVKGNCANCHASSTDLHKLLPQDCEKCHSTNAWMPSNFNHTMLQGSIGNCLSCHQKPTESYHNQFHDNCTQCHSTDNWTPASFDHSTYFRLDENHNAKCNTCHTDNKFSSYTCYGCHEHSQNKITEKHNKHGIYGFGNCASCHKSGNEHDLEGKGSEHKQEDHGEHEEEDD